MIKKREGRLRREDEINLWILMKNDAFDKLVQAVAAYDTHISTGMFAVLCI